MGLAKFTFPSFCRGAISSTPITRSYHPIDEKYWTPTSSPERLGTLHDVYRCRHSTIWRCSITVASVEPIRTREVTSTRGETAAWPQGTLEAVPQPPLHTPATPKSGAVSLERHCSVGELSKLWGFSENTIRRLFRKEPGVLKIAHEETRQKRRYTTMRIPERVAQRVHRRLQGLA